MNEWVDGWMDDGWMDGWMAGWINSMKSMHTVDYDTAMKRSEVLTQVTTWMHLEHTMLRERETSTEGRTVCGSTDRDLPEQEVHRDRK